MVDKEKILNFNLGDHLNLKGKKAENFVHELSKKTFLTDWCYLNPKLPNGKEICDLLIIYDDIMIIWQIKDLKLKDGRYSEGKVKKNLKQLVVAKNRLLNSQVSIELENSRRGKEKFCPEGINEVYLISALLGEGEDYFSLEEEIKGNKIYTFTRRFTEVILNELDTIKDFISYFREQVKLFSDKKTILLNGEEEELLAFYLMNNCNFDRFKEVNMIVIENGIWKELQSKPEYLAKKEEDKISYGWDSIINRTHTCGKDYELVARELARPSRFERRVLSKTFFEAHVLAHNESKDTFRRIFELNGTTYCFVFMDDIEPRENRKSMMGATCFIARGLNKGSKKVIGIATEMKFKPTCSYDFYYLNKFEWTDEDENKAKEMQNQTEILTNFNTKYAREDEYPV